MLVEQAGANGVVDVLYEVSGLAGSLLPGVEVKVGGRYRGLDVVWAHHFTLSLLTVSCRWSPSRTLPCCLFVVLLLHSTRGYR